MLSTPPGLAGLRSIAIVLPFTLALWPKIAQHTAVFQMIRHPALNVLVQLTSIHAAVLAHLFAYYLPGALEIVGSRASRGEREFCAKDGAIDRVRAWGSEPQTARVNLIEIGEDLEL